MLPAVEPATPSAHVVLVEPEIPWNAGNAGRSCLAFGARLHLVGPLGFSLDEKAVRRAGLDYWKHVDLAVWDGWEPFEREVVRGGPLPWLVTPEGERTPWEVDLGTCPILLFGTESSGLPARLRATYPERKLRFPTLPGPIRSLNVSTTVGMMLAEVARTRPSIVSPRP